jgi:hypothetical protein
MDITEPAARPRHRRILVMLLAAVALGAVTVGGGTLRASAATVPHTTIAGHITSQAPACVDPQRPLSHGYDAATKGDAAFNKDFRHCFTAINGVQMHYVIGGYGPKTMVLLHGWPESWYEFHGVMPSLLAGRTVIAVDLPGLGDSTGNPPNYEKTVLATYVHLLLDRLGKDQGVQFVAHDFGVGVAYALAAQYRHQAAGPFLMDWLFQERPEEFNAQVLEWITGLPDPDPRR